MTNFKVGYYLMEDDCKIGFGSWSINFKKGQVLKYTSDNKMYSWDTDKNDWKLRSPPISGREDLNLDTYGYKHEREDLMRDFSSKSKVLTKKQAEKLTSEMNINDVELIIKKAGIEVIDGMIKKEDLAKAINVIKKMK